MRVENFLRDNAALRGGRKALVDGDVHLTFAELEKLSDQMAGALAGEGVASGDHVVIFMENSWQAVVSLFAVLKVGAVFIPVDPATPSDRLAEHLEVCPAVGLVTQSRLARPTADAMAKSDALRLVVIAGCEGSPAVEGLLRFEDAIACDGIVPVLPTALGSDPAMLTFRAETRSLAAIAHDALAAASIGAVGGDAAGLVVHCPGSFTTDEGLYRILATIRLGLTAVLTETTGNHGLIDKRAAMG